MATDDQGSPLPVRASAEDWGWVESGAWGVRLMRAEVAYRCLVELRDRVAALEAAAAADHFPDAGKMVIPTPEPDTNAVLKLAAIIREVDGSHSLGAAALAEAILSHSAAREVFAAPILPLKDHVHPSPTAAPAGGVTEEELEKELAEAFGSITATYYTVANHLLDHPRIGPLLRGEGGKRVVLAERPPVPKYMAMDPFGAGCLTGYHDGWAAARAEVARQQGEGS